MVIPTEEALEKIGEIVYGRHIRGFILWPLCGDEKQRISDVLEEMMRIDDGDHRHGVR